MSPQTHFGCMLGLSMMLWGCRSVRNDAMVVQGYSSSCNERMCAVSRESPAPLSAKLSKVADGLWYIDIYNSGDKCVFLSFSCIGIGLTSEFVFVMNEEAMCANENMLCDVGDPCRPRTNARFPMLEEAEAFAFCKEVWIPLQPTRAGESRSSANTIRIALRLPKGEGEDYFLHNVSVPCRVVESKGDICDSPKVVFCNIRADAFNASVDDRLVPACCLRGFYAHPIDLNMLRAHYAKSGECAPEADIPCLARVNFPSFCSYLCHPDSEEQDHRLRVLSTTYHVTPCSHCVVSDSDIRCDDSSREGL